MNKLMNKVAVVTGAASGIGSAITHLFLSEGASVFAIDRNEKRLDELKHQNILFKKKLMTFQMDLANDDENIYLAIKNGAPESLTRILARGISFTANIENKKIPAMITFPLLDRTPGKKRNETEQPEPEEIQKRIIERIKEIRVDGFKEIIDGGISLNNSYGIKAAAAFDSKDNLIQEIAIPIRLLGILPGRTEPVTYGIRINGFVGPAAVQRRDMTNFDDMYGGRYGGRFGRNFDGMYGGMPNRNYPPVRISTSTEFFIKSHLAIKQ
jgi:hypothetical protein